MHISYWAYQQFFTILLKKLGESKLSEDEVEKVKREPKYIWECRVADLLFKESKWGRSYFWKKQESFRPVITVTGYQDFEGKFDDQILINSLNFLNYPLPENIQVAPSEKLVRACIQFQYFTEDKLAGWYSDNKKELFCYDKKSGEILYHVIKRQADKTKHKNRIENQNIETTNVELSKPAIEFNGVLDKRSFKSGFDQGDGLRLLNLLIDASVAYEVKLDHNIHPPRTFIKSKFFLNIEDELEFNKQLVFRHVKKYFDTIAEKNYQLALKFWHIEQISERWQGNVLEFAKQFYFTQDIEKEHILVGNVKVSRGKGLTNYHEFLERKDQFIKERFPPNNALNAICEIHYKEGLRSYYLPEIVSLFKEKIANLETIKATLEILSQKLASSGGDDFTNITLGQILQPTLSHTLAKKNLFDLEKLNTVFSDSYILENFRTMTVYLKNVSYMDGGYLWYITDISPSSTNSVFR